MAVVGFDDIEEGRYGAISLTTIAPDKEAIARMAVESIVGRLTDGPPEEAPGGGPRQLQPAFALLERESTVGRQAGRPLD